jgi:8-oxo-dGTP pyrophosphatase MutT (NUDIX family)
LKRSSRPLEEEMPSESNPWTTLASRVVYQNPWIKVREDQVIHPGGGQGIYGVVECKAAIGVVALTDQQELWLVGQYRYPTDRYSWELIEGGAEAQESPLEAGKRELEEEAGLIAAEWEVLGHEIQLSNCYSSELAYFFVAKGLTEVEKKPDPTEVLKLRKVPLREAQQMVLKGEITDAMSVIGIMLACERINPSR